MFITRSINGLFEILWYLLNIAKLCSLSNLENFHRDFIFISDLKLTESHANDNDFVTHRVFFKYLFDIVMPLFTGVIKEECWYTYMLCLEDFRYHTSKTCRQVTTFLVPFLYGENTQKSVSVRHNIYLKNSIKRIDCF